MEAAATMHDTMPDCGKIHLWKLRRDPVQHYVHCISRIRHTDERSVDRGRICALRLQSCRTAQSCHLASAKEIEFGSVCIKRKLQARRSGIDRKYRGAHARWVNSTPRATEARRLRTLSARLARTIGTRAPSTIPAESAS